MTQIDELATPPAATVAPEPEWTKSMCVSIQTAAEKMMGAAWRGQPHSAGTAVNELFIKPHSRNRLSGMWLQNRAGTVRYAMRAIRSFLIDRRRHRNAAMRGGTQPPSAYDGLTAPNPGPFDSLDQKEMRSKVAAAIASLSDRDRRIVVGCLVDGKTMKQVATQLGVSGRSVRRWLPEIVARLRHQVDADAVRPGK